jgi:hypothetical protein
VNATAFSHTGCSDLASAPELFPSGARAAATSPPAFVNKPYHFFQLLPDPLLLNLTHTTFACKYGNPNKTAQLDSGCLRATNLRRKGRDLWPQDSCF